MIKIHKDTETLLLELYEQKNIALEGNILKIIDITEQSKFTDYIKQCTDRDKDNRRKRLEITKQIQNQNKELIASQEQNQQLMSDLQEALKLAEHSKSEAITARDHAMQDLDLIQKKTQFELINLIVKISLVIIIGVGILTTAMYAFALINHVDTLLISTAWSNMFGILLTNAFSIIGTIMGVKYASEKPGK
jgi:hypothetical protein